MEIVQMGQVQNPQSRSAEELFKLYDRDGKGYIDKDDLMRVA
jgi:Ca2+-binding EF-hand superfamily protein